MYLKQSTSVVIQFGPFLDKTDGVTLETGLVSAIDHGTTGILLSKNGGTLTIRHATVTASTYDAHGCYKVTLDTTDTNTLGSLRVIYTDAATCCPVWQDFEVVSANIYDSFIGGGDILDVSMTQILGTAVATPTVAGVLEVDLTHVAGSTTDVSTLATNVQIIENLLDTEIGAITTSLANINADTDNIQTRLPAALTGTGNMVCDVIAISGDSTAADNFETMLDGTGGQVFSLKQLNVVNTTGSAIVASSTGSNGSGINASGHGTGSGFKGSGGGSGTTGPGASFAGSTGIRSESTAIDGDGMQVVGAGTGVGLVVVAGGTGNVHAVTLTPSGTGVGLNSSFAANSVNASVLATDAVTEIQSGLATSAALATVQADTDNIQTRLPAALVGGKMDCDVTAISGDTAAADNAEAFFDGTGYAGTNNVIPLVTTTTTATNVTTVNGLAANTVNASALAADAVTEIQAGLATSAAVASVQADTDNIQTRLPATLVGGKMDSDMTAISGDTAAADSFETMLDATGGSTLTLKSLVVNNTTGTAVQLTGGSGGNGLQIAGNGSGVGVRITGGGAGTTGIGLVINGSLAVDIESLSATNGYGMHIFGAGDSPGLLVSKGSGVGTKSVIFDGDVEVLSNIIGTVSAIADKAGFSLAAAGLDAVIVESGINARQGLAGMMAALLGQLSGAATTNVIITNAGGVVTRVTATVDPDGNRSAVTLNLPA